MKRGLIATILALALGFSSTATVWSEPIIMVAESHKYMVPAGTVYTTSEQLVLEDIENFKEFQKSIQPGMTQKEIEEKLYQSNIKVLKKYKNEAGMFKEPTLLETVEPMRAHDLKFVFNQKETVLASWIKMRFKSQVIWVFIEWPVKK